MQLRSPRRRFPLLACFLTACLLLPLVGCADSTDSENPALFSYYGSVQAQKIANAYPYRSAYSQEEQNTAAYLYNLLVDMGYQPEVQSFTAAEDSGYSGSSQNLIVTVPGTGFYRTEDVEAREKALEEQNWLLSLMNRIEEKVSGTESTGSLTPTPTPSPTPQLTVSGDQSAVQDSLEDLTVYHRTMIMAARYDTPVSADQAADYPDYNGISDNASGVAALLTLLNNLREQPVAYDLQIVFMGACNDQSRGAAVYLSSLDDATLSVLDGAFILRSIYGGDKLYAHAGHNSLNEGQKYAMRRKLYDAVNASLEGDLNSEIGVSLMTNQGSYSVTLEDGGESYIYREFTLEDGDYQPFDNAGIPVVFMEAGQYDVPSADEVSDSAQNELEATGGQIKGTDYDATWKLMSLYDADQLRFRINAAAYIMLTCADTPVDDYTAVSAADAAAVSTEAEASTGTAAQPADSTPESEPDPSVTAE
ncbi:MAG: M28 family peptidase [Oscillospiraceae bacterium]|nr:M28 family peptidase [Oscillospiraceae bacterium]